MNLMAKEHAQRKVGEIQALIDVSRLITVVDLNKVLSETLTIVAGAVGANKGSLILLDADGKPYQRFITQRDLPPEDSKIVVSRVLQEGLAGWCVREKRGTIVSDADKDGRWLIFDDDDQTDVRSALGVPFIFEDRVHAVMTLVNDQADHFTRQDLQLATAIANQASAAIRNAHLFDSIQTQQRQLETVLENAGEVMFMLNNSLDFVQANHEAANLFGLSQAKLVGLNLRDIGPDTPLVCLLIERLETSDFAGGNLVFELHDDIAQQDYMAKVARVENDQLQRGYVVVLHNITLMRDLDRLKSHMMRMASHDLKNPLSIIWGYVELIRSDIQEGMMPDIKLVDGIVRSLNRMEELIEELLNAERLERESRFRDSPIQPDQIIRHSIDEMAEGIQRSQLQLVENIGPELPSLSGDPTQLRQAMVNLLSNAVKYTPEGGVITVHANVDGDRFHFSVEDTGIGIPKSMQGSIFNQLYRAMRPEIEHIEGTGVGLSLVKEIVERHGGQVWFRSEEGQGSIFGFWIPVQ